MKIKFVHFCIIFLTIGLLIAQDDYYEEKLTYAGDLGFAPMLGFAVVSNGEDLVISSSGEVHFYNHVDNNWIEYQVIDEPVPISNFGVQLQIAENVLYISADGEESGKVYIYHKANGTWSQQDVVEPEDPDVYNFGAGFHFTDDLALIYAQALDEEENLFDVVFIYQYTDEIWSEAQRFDGPEDNGGFGSGLLVTDDLLLIGDSSHDGPIYDDSGVVHCYVHSGGEWQENMLLTPSNPTEGGGFGYGIVKSNGFYLISAPGETMNPPDPDYPGLVYVYRYEAGEFIETDVLSSSDGEGWDKFGNAVSAGDSTLVISAYKNDDGGSGSGSAYIFKLNENDQWEEFKKIIPSDVAGADFFGWAAALSDDYVFISSPMKDNMTGAVYIFDPDDNSLHANFAGDARNGNAPVTVQFTAVPQGNPTAYEWDFNSDGFVDSTEPNPQFTYYINGVYTVTLTVYDETGSDDEVKTDYIQVVSDILFGDVNGDGILDVSDLVMYIDFVMGYSAPEEDQFLAGDVNYSGQIDIMDIVMVVNEIIE